MANMTLKEFDDMKMPSRRPWIFALLIVIVGVGLYMVFSTRKSGEKDEESALPVEELIEGVEEAEDLPPPADTAEILAQARAMEADGALVEARAAYYRALAMARRSAKVRREVQPTLGRINTTLLLSPRKMPEKEAYIVKSGDSLQVIARRYGTTVELIQKSNRIMDPNRIKSGDVLRIFTGSFRIEVSKSRNDLLLYMNDRFFKRYRVSTGKYGKTPVGTFKIRDKTVEPTWWRPDGKEVPFGDKENILGTRWMSIRATDDTPDARGYGIHGTWDNSSIGKSASAGCVRMINADVEELFAMVPSGTPVVISE